MARHDELEAFNCRFVAQVPDNVVSTMNSAFVAVDYTKRMEPTDIIKILKTI